MGLRSGTTLGGIGGNRPEAQRSVPPNRHGRRATIRVRPRPTLDPSLGRRVDGSTQEWYTPPRGTGPTLPPWKDRSSNEIRPITRGTSSETLPVSVCPSRDGTVGCDDLPSVLRL